MSNSRSFSKLHPLMQRWVWRQNWAQLRDVQEQAIEAISTNEDVVIAAATASGKTEAAFLPLLGSLLEQLEKADNCNIICVSPLKALINDQTGRLENMCQLAEIPVVPWHGEASVARKRKFIDKPTGVVLITPESLEALMDTRGPDILRRIFGGTIAVVIDELHAFIGDERGKQLQSLLHRMESIANKAIQRVGLSATLGDMSLAAEFLRPNSTRAPRIVVSTDNSSNLLVQVRGYPYGALPVSDSSNQPKAAPELEQVVTSNMVDISKHLYSTLKGHNNLIFPNSRRSVEVYSDLLRRLCEREGRLNEFWPHHGSLAKDVRTDAEQALKDKSKPATAIATTTLELGLDVGDIKAVAQVEAPPSVASLRQRMGRSGRREGESAILRAYCSELVANEAENPTDTLREGLVQTIAMILLLLDKWCEPPVAHGMHLSTLVQQLLALIAERNGISPAGAYKLLITTGPFKGVSSDEFSQLLRHMSSKDLLIQDSRGYLFHGLAAERAVNHFDFYAAFATQDEYKLQISGGRTLGSLPLEKPVSYGDHIVFGGKRWRVMDVDSSKKIITIVPAAGARPPSFEGSGMAPVHQQIRQKMRIIYESTVDIPFLDDNAKQLLAEGRAAYQKMNLASHNMVRYEGTMLLFTWQSDKLNSALALMLSTADIPAQAQGMFIECHASESEITSAIIRLAGQSAPAPETIAALVANRYLAKWDWALPESLLNKGYASLWLEVSDAYNWCKRYAAGLPH